MKIKCPHCGAADLEVCTGQLPYSTEHMQCPKCDSTYPYNIIEALRICPNCTDYVDNSPIPLDEYEGVLFCPGPHGDGGCGFEYDIEKGKPFKHVLKKFYWIWVLLCVCTFGRAEVYRREYY